MSNRVQILIWWVVPISAQILNYAYWTLVRGTTIAFPLFMTLVPLIFGLVGVGTTTRLWDVWKWKLSWPHVAFQYSSYGVMGPLFFNDTITEPFSLMVVAKMGLLVGIQKYLLGTVFDVHSMEEGHLVVPHTIGWGTVRAVTSYSFWFFGWLGLCMGVEAKIAYYYLVELGRVDMLAPLVAGSVAFMSITIIAYFGRNLLRDGWPKLRAPLDAQHATTPTDGKSAA
ncbi:hypothetical protein WME99_14960 [Sorangium sp. So ce136]|uniref:hypothetical protein n=1 Tax=Sorangium sp. So ce136 TaxID=3133284 RepID=UPI003F0F5710